MWYIWEKIGPNILLHPERFVETIDRRDEWSKLIISLVTDCLEPGTIDIQLEPIDDQIHWCKNPTNPEIVETRDDNEKYHIGSEESSEEPNDELPLRSITIPSCRIGDNSHDIGERIHLRFFLRYSECVSSFCSILFTRPWLDIELWIISDIAEWCRDSWELTHYRLVLILFLDG